MHSLFHNVWEGLHSHGPGTKRLAGLVDACTASFTMCGRGVYRGRVKDCRVILQQITTDMDVMLKLSYCMTMFLLVTNRLDTLVSPHHQADILLRLSGSLLS